MRRLLIVFALAFLPCSTTQAADLSVNEYRDRLGAIDRALAGGDVPTAQSLAAALAADHVRWNGRVLATDTSLLTPIATRKEVAELRRLRVPLRSTIAALAKLPAAAGIRSDPRLLEEIRRADAPTALRRGGELATIPRTNEGFWRSVARRLQAGWDWLVDALEKLYDWLPSFSFERGNSVGGGIPFTVTALVLLIVAMLLLLALEMWRRSRKREAMIEATGTLQLGRGNADDDPLSRETNEWERYAMELAAAGRVREAIRAWYHAVLVALYRSGLVHYRKGKTNWEYVAALPAALPWRAQFSAITRLFEREWYGRERSSVEALDNCAADARRLLAVIQRRGATA